MVIKKYKIILTKVIFLSFIFFLHFAIQDEKIKSEFIKVEIGLAVTIFNDYVKDEKIKKKKEKEKNKQTKD